MRRVLLTSLALTLAGGCRAVSPEVGEPARNGDEIEVAGSLLSTGTRVVLWHDSAGLASGPGHHGVREGVPARAGIEDLRGVVNRIVIHYDAAGGARRCFSILEQRGLSSHFLVDLDGTVFQTLDVRAKAWHAGAANETSVGIEVANIGAYPDRKPVDDWYAAHDARPARPGPVRGRIQGMDLWQQDFTEAQYAALARLVAALCRVLGVPPEAPRGPDGRVTTVELPGPPEVRDFRGIVGHYHVSARKVDPGPAFRWEEFLAAVRAALR